MGSVKVRKPAIPSENIVDVVAVFPPKRSAFGGQSYSFVSVTELSLIGDRSTVLASDRFGSEVGADTLISRSGCIKVIRADGSFDDS